MRWTLYAPLIALAACIGAALVMLAPVLAAVPSLAASASVRWIEAAEDGRPRRLVEGERARTLGTPDIVSPGPMRQYWLPFDRSAAPAGPIGLMVLPADSSARLFINGLAVIPGPRGPHGSALLGEVERDGLQAGANRAEIIAAPSAVHRWPRAVFLGPLEPLLAAERRLAQASYLTVRGAAFLGAGSALLGFLLAFGLRRRLILVQPSLLALLLAGQAALAWLAPAGPGLLPWNWLALVLPAAAALLILLIVGTEPAAWARSTRVAFRLGAGGLFALLVAAPLSLWSPQAALLVGHWASTLTVLAGAGAALILLLAGTAARPSGREPWTPSQGALGALACLSLLASVAASADWLGPWGLVLGQLIAGLAALLALAGWLAWTAVRGFLDLEAALRGWLGLGQIIRRQQVQLAAQQAALEAEISQRAVLEERERLSRDIHDGVGGSLTSLLLQARTGRLAGDDLAKGLEEALDELRLMIDALDHSPESLPAAFSVLRARLAPAFRAAGITLDWSHEALEGHALRNPRSLLQVFRILQEACSNVIRHSGAGAARVRIGWNAQAGELEVEVEDDGAGGPPGSQAGPVPQGADGRIGRGLANMVRRAGIAGGSLTAGPRDGGGWRVSLRVPGEQAEPALSCGPGR